MLCYRRFPTDCCRNSRRFKRVPRSSSSSSMSSYSPDRNNRLSSSTNHVHLITGREQGQSNRPFVRNFFKSSEILARRMAVASTLTGHHGCVNSVLFSKNCQFILTGSDDMKVHMYRYGQSDPVYRFNTLHRNNIFYARDLDESNGKYVTCAADGRVILMNIERDFGHTTSSDQVLHKHRGRAHRISICPDSSDMFFSAGEDGVICLFDLRSSFSSRSEDDTADSRAIMKTGFLNRNRTSSVYAICVNNMKPNYLAACGSSQYVCIYDTRKFTTPIAYYCPKHLRNEKHKHISGIKFDYSCDHIVASFNDEAVYRHNIDRHAYDAMESSTGASSESSVSAPSDEFVDDRDRGYCNAYRGHRNRDTVKQVAFYGSRSEFVVSGSDCGHLFLWDTQSAEIINVINADSSGAINCITSHDTLPVLAVSGLDCDAKVIEPIADFKEEDFEKFRDKVVKLNQTRRSTLWETQSISSALQHLVAHNLIDSDSPTSGLANLIAMMLTPNDDDDDDDDEDDEGDDQYDDDNDDNDDNNEDDDDDEDEDNEDGDDDDDDDDLYNDGVEVDHDACGDYRGDASSSGSEHFVFNFVPREVDDDDDDDDDDDGGNSDDDEDSGSGITASSAPRGRTTSEDVRANALINMVRDAVGAKAKAPAREPASSDKKQRRT